VKVWIVIAFRKEFDEYYNWVMGVYDSEEEAKKAVDASQVLGKLKASVERPGSKASWVWCEQNQALRRFSFLSVEEHELISHKGSRG
jgi:hypothetical protein